MFGDTRVTKLFDTACDTNNTLLVLLHQVYIQ